MINSGDDSDAHFLGGSGSFFPIYFLYRHFNREFESSNQTNQL